MTTDFSRHTSREHIGPVSTRTDDQHREAHNHKINNKSAGKGGWSAADHDLLVLEELVKKVLPSAIIYGTDFDDSSLLHYPVHRIRGPHKREDRAIDKAINVTSQRNADFAAGLRSEPETRPPAQLLRELTDVVRMTVCVDKEAQLTNVFAELEKFLDASHQFDKIEGKFAKSDPTNSKNCGYSGMNFRIGFSNNNIVELQANVPGILWGKESKKDFLNMFGTRAKALWTEQEAIYGGRLPCGMGHILYEMYDKEKNEWGQRARKVSISYYDYLRECKQDHVKVGEIVIKLDELKAGRPQYFNKK